jgi:iron complex outermembrane receptor protein
MKPVRFIAGALLTITGLAPLSAQTGTVRGHVTVNDATHNPIAGVSVTVGGRGTVTLSDGSYMITGLPARSDSVRARIIGYAPQAKAFTLAGNDTVVVDFALDAQAVNLSEVVVVGYGTQKAGDVTTSIKQVSASDFNPGNAVSPQALIENKVAGVQVIDNNEPGGGFSVRIRGAASATAGTDPLYVIDGVPIGGGSGGGLSVTTSTTNSGTDPLAFLNPNDIESITILKDASASAIYGSNASNGVVLITTKSGRGRATVEYDGNYSASSVTRLPSMLTTAQFRAAVQAHDTAALGQLGSANTDWFSLIDRTGAGTQHNISMTGSGPTNNYRLSLGYLNQDGILQSSSSQRISLNAHYDQRLYSDRLDLQANITGSRVYDNSQPGGVLYNAAQMGGTQPVFDGTSTTGYYNWPGNSLTSPDNPLEVLNGALDHTTTLRSVGNFQAKYDFSQFPALQGLTATANLGFDVTNIDRVAFYSNNIHLQTKNGNDGSFFEQTPTQTNSLLDLFLNYQPQNLLGPGAIDFTGGYSYSQSHTRQPSISETKITTNLLTDNGIPLSLNPPIPQLQDTAAKLISFFGRVGYNINDKYLFSASIRRDGSSKFGPNDQWGNFPGVSAGWRISQEPFFHVAPVSDLKLRASWGKTGNQAINSYLFISTYQPCTSTAEAQFGNAFVCPFRPSAVDPNIKWESTATTDLGFDYGLLGSRLTGSFDWYNKKTDDLLFNVPIDPASNLSNYVTTNIGSMKNTGFDFDITARMLDAAPGSDGLSWTASFNMNHNTNELLSINPNAVGGGTTIPVGGIAGGVGSTIQVLQPGLPINSFYVCQQTYQNGKPVDGVYVPNPTDTTSTRTNCKLGTNSRAYHDPAPHWIFGLTNTMTYKHFDLSFTLRAWLGNYVYNNVASNLGNWRQLTAGSSPYNLQSSVLTTNFQNQQLFSDYYVENGSFLRMDNISIGYTFPWAGEQLRLYAIVQNAFTITGYSGVDPTAGAFGIDNNIYPRARTVTGGLNVKF